MISSGRTSHSLLIQNFIVPYSKRGADLTIGVELRMISWQSETRNVGGRERNHRDNGHAQFPHTPFRQYPPIDLHRRHLIVEVHTAHLAMAAPAQSHQTLPSPGKEDTVIPPMTTLDHQIWTHRDAPGLENGTRIETSGAGVGKAAPKNVDDIEIQCDTAPEGTAVIASTRVELLRSGGP